MFINIAHNSPEIAKIFTPKKTKLHPLMVCFCIQYRNSFEDQFHNLSDCVLCALPLFLMVTNFSLKPPLTPFEATSCGETWQGVHSLKRELAGNRNTRIKLDQTWVNLSDSGSLTVTGWVGASLDGCVPEEMHEVKSRLELTVFVSWEPRGIGWSLLVRLMVLWLLNGREGWSLSQSACRQCNSKK